MQWVLCAEELKARGTLFLGGGGFKTLGFLGVLDVLGWDCWDHASGVSAGAFMALMIVLGFSPGECMETFLANEHLLLQHFSISRVCQGEAPLQPQLVKDVVCKVLARKGFSSRATLADLAGRRRMQWSAVCFCVESLRLVRLSAETHPTLVVADVLAAAVALPLLFPPVSMGAPPLQYYDAGLLSSAPLEIFDPCSTVALVVRSAPSRTSGGCSQTLQFRCSFWTKMAGLHARTCGMQVLQVPYPETGVGLLMRGNVSLSTCSDMGVLYTVLYVIRAEILGLLALLVCSPSSCGATPPRGRQLWSAPISSTPGGCPPRTPCSASGSRIITRRTSSVPLHRTARSSPRGSLR